MKKIAKKNETSNNDIIAEIDKRFERHTNVLMEQMKHEVKTVAEGHSILVKKLDKVESEIGEIKKDVHELKNDMAIVKPALERNCKDVQGLKQDMREVKSELGSVKMIVMNISHEINDHEKRIKKVEEKVFV